jgi:hypothetical protein
MEYTVNLEILQIDLKTLEEEEQDFMLMVK